MHRRASVLALSLLCAIWSACIPFVSTNGVFIGFGLLCLEEDICSCLAFCNASYNGDVLEIGACVPPHLVGDCSSAKGIGPRLPRIPFGTSYEAPAGAWFTLGSYEAGASSGQQLGFTVGDSVVETYRAVATYPPEFTWLGFDALGGAPVGSFGFDLDRDGVVDFAVPVLPNGPDQAYVDVDRTGSPTALDVTVDRTGSHQLTVTLPLGGDGRLATIATTIGFDALVTLAPGILVNPPTPGPRALSVELTSIDADTGGEDDGAGESPASFMVGEMVEIGSGPCPSSPSIGCNGRFERASLSILDKGGARDRFSFKLKKGALEDGAFGDPLTDNSHATCVYDGSDALIMEMPVAAGGVDARGKDLWKIKAATTRFKDKTGAQSGVVSVKQRSGSKAQARVKGKGAALPLPSLPVTPPLRVQHRTLEGTCIEANFVAPTRNDAAGWKAKVR